MYLCIVKRLGHLLEYIVSHKTFKTMIGFSHIRAVSDVNFDDKTIRLQWFGSVADYRQDSFSDVSECASMLVTSYEVSDVVVGSMWTQINGISHELSSVDSLSDDSDISVFFEVKFKIVDHVPVL